MYVVWKKRPLKPGFCPLCLGESKGPRWSWIPLVVESRRVGGKPRQMHVARLPSIRSCCLESEEARGAWWASWW